MMDLSVIVVLLAGLAADELPAQSGKSSKPAPAASTPAPVPVQEGERPALSTAEIKLLRDTNIFAPRSARRSSPRSSPSGRDRIHSPSTPAKPKAPVVTGIFFDAKSQAFVVVVEDRNLDSLKQFKEPKFLKVGDEFAGFKVSSVTDEKAVFARGEVSKELKVGESLPAEDGKPTSAAPATEDAASAAAPSEEPAEIRPADDEANAEALKRLKEKVGKKNRPSRDE